MKTLQEARDLAQRDSVYYECVQHVNFRVGYDQTTDQYVVKGYLVSDWQDDSTVESFYNGRHQRYDM